MKKILAIGASLVALAACTTSAPKPDTDLVTFGSGTEALNAYYRQMPSDRLPVGPELLSLDATQPVTRLLIGSCNNEERDNAAFATIAQQNADAFLFVGDNVYGDMDGRSYMNFDIELNELREAYTDLASTPGYQAIAAKMPVLATWDDHDYGMNDEGRNFGGRILAERMFERFYRLDETEVAARPGVYYSKMAGPEGQRTQIIMLDTRFFRSDLTPTDEYGAPGKERYVPSADPDQDLLGPAQWAWLEEELKKPADLRLLVSSIQITPDVHGWESWDKMPKERDRLYDLLKSTKANGVVMVSGDRHTAFLYKDEDRGNYPYYELTASSLNAVFAKDPKSAEYDARQIGDGYTFGNFGAVDIDWEAGMVGLSILDEAGAEISSVKFSFADIATGSAN